MKFEVKIKPVASPRPRVSRFGTYMPGKYVFYKEAIKNSFIKENPKFTPFTGELKVRIETIFAVPKSYSKKKRQMLLPIPGICEHGAGYKGREDIDNLAKSILDALNGVAYVDDSQITCLLVFKTYGEEDKVIVEIEEIGQFI